MAAASGLRGERSLLGYFHQALRDASRNQRVDGSDATLHYLTHLLTDYAATDRVFDHGANGRRLQPLALLYGQALEARSAREQQLLLRRLGDLALFIAGLFRGRLQRRLTDLDYCIGMGGSAYSHLYQLSDGTPHQRDLRGVFGELASSFGRWTGVLAEVGARRHGAKTDGALDLYLMWLHTGNPELAERLRAAGLMPVATADHRARH
jgi:hypothetical protein